jgi:hypothetical protein
MKKIYSIVNKKKLIASVISKSEISSYRQDLCPDSEFIQISARKFDELIEVPAHKHFKIDRKTDRTQEAWIIIEGKVKAEIFDLDDRLIAEQVLTAGDCIVLFRGGHSLKVIDKNTIMYETKNGPYFGKQNDKTNI